MVVGRLERVQRKVAHQVSETETELHYARREKDHLEVEQEEIRDELEEVVTEKRAEELRALHLQVEAEEVEDTISDEKAAHRDQLKVSCFFF